MIRRLFVLLMLCSASFVLLPACSEGGENTETAAACADCAGDGCSCKAGECDCEGCGG